MENIINECLGLPTNFLKDFNHDRSWDFMVALRYFPASNDENVGITEHEDGNCITFVLQDEVGGLQLLRNEEWVPVVPAEGTIVVNVGDVIQVSNPMAALMVVLRFRILCRSVTNNVNRGYILSKFSRKYFLRSYLIKV